MGAWVEEVVRAFRFADAVDIALVATFLYAVLLWFKQTASRSVLVGVVLLALIYLFARAFDLYMTALLFQAVFAGLLVMLVVVFQEDLRRAFERLGAWGKIGERRQLPDDLTYLEIISETAASLAARRVGALIVLAGKDPLERHLSGGVSLDGKVSRSLLESIFDPHSEGHDGAVIVDDGRITQFSVHLPLARSHNFNGHGTRHAAALGLSERCDALVVVVSEERGRMSIAERGKLQPMESVVDLETRLEQFWRRNFPQPEDSFTSRLLRDNFAIKTGAIALACLAWLLLSHQAETVQQSFVVPVEFRNVPEKFVVTESDPVSVNVTLTGPERAFFLLEPSTLKVSFDMSKIDQGPQYFSIEDRNIARPSALEIYRIEPPIVRMIVHQFQPVTLKVDVPLKGELPDPLRLGGVKVEPASIKAISYLADSAVSPTIQVEPVDLSQITKNTTLKARLVVPEHVRFPSGAPPEVRITVELTKAAASGEQSAQ